MLGLVPASAICIPASAAWDLPEQRPQRSAWRPLSVTLRVDEAQLRRLQASAAGQAAAILADCDGRRAGTREHLFVLSALRAGRPSQHCTKVLSISFTSACTSGSGSPVQGRSCCRLSAGGSSKEAAVCCRTSCRSDSGPTGGALPCASLLSTHQALHYGLALRRSPGARLPSQHCTKVMSIFKSGCTSGSGRPV